MGTTIRQQHFLESAGLGGRVKTDSPRSAINADSGSMAWPDGASWVIGSANVRRVV
jgi:hypothetical protein